MHDLEGRRPGRCTANAEPLSRQPGLVRDYLERSIIRGSDLARSVQLEQTGQMWQKPGGRGMSFTATEALQIGTVAFSWRARFPLLGPLAINVTDEYSHGEGKLEARLLGLRVMRQQGKETDLGEALRYLAELPWIPHAMAANADLEWREIHEHAVEVATVVGSERAAVQIDFNTDGDIIKTSSESRPRPVGKTYTPTAWGGTYSDYAELAGVRIPTSADVYWQQADGPFTYWRGQILTMRLAD
ncbi:MAG: DUF6544 family protein [Gaiellaceae bacterium]